MIISSLVDSADSAVSILFSTSFPDLLLRNDRTFFMVTITLGSAEWFFFYSKGHSPGSIMVKHMNTNVTDVCQDI